MVGWECLEMSSNEAVSRGKKTPRLPNQWTGIDAAEEGGSGSPSGPIRMPNRTTITQT